MTSDDPLAAIRERDARAECVEEACHPGARDRRVLLAIIDGLNDGYGQEIARLRQFIPPDGWVHFGTHANCRPRSRIEMSEAVGEDGLPLWERPVSERPHIWGEETL